MQTTGGGSGEARAKPVLSWALESPGKDSALPWSGAPHCECFSWAQEGLPLPTTSFLSKCRVHRAAEVTFHVQASF